MKSFINKAFLLSVLVVPVSVVANDATDVAVEKVEVAKEAMSDAVEAAQAVQDALTDVAEAAQDVAVEQAEDAQASISNALEIAQDVASEKTQEAQEALSDAVEAVQEQLAEKTEKAQELLDSAIEFGPEEQGFFNRLAESIEGNLNWANETIVEAPGFGKLDGVLKNVTGKDAELEEGQEPGFLAENHDAITKGTYVVGVLAGTYVAYKLVKGCVRAVFAQ